MTVKRKRVIATLLSMAIVLSCNTINVLADVNNVDSVNVPITIDTTNTNTVTGYIAEITYNPEALVPVLADADVLGEDCYAINNINRGYITADKVQDGKIVVGWADKEHYDLENGNVLANINFNVLPDAKCDFRNSEGEFTTVNTKIFQVARYPDIMLGKEFDYLNNYKLNDNYAISYVHNFTTDGLNDNYFSISGNLSNSKGRIEYNDLALTSCLKIETNTSIAFDGGGILTLVFGQANSNINIDGNEYVADENGVLTVDLESGSHEITKVDVANLYYMSLDTSARDLETTSNDDMTSSDEVESGAGVEIDNSVIIIDGSNNVDSPTIADLPGVPAPPESDIILESEISYAEADENNTSFFKEIASTIIIE